MENFLESHDDDDESIADEDRRYTISKAGVEEILGWIRFQTQMCEMIHNEMESCDEKEHEIAMLMAFALHPWIEFYGISYKDDDENKDEE